MPIFEVKLMWAPMQKNVDHRTVLLQKVPMRRVHVVFEDDGGTPGWRGRQPKRKRLTFMQSLVLVVFTGLILPFLILFGVPLFGALYVALAAPS